MEKPDEPYVIMVGADTTKLVEIAFKEEIIRRNGGGIVGVICGDEPIQSTSNALTHANIEHTLVEIISNHKPSDSNWISPEDFEAERNHLYDHEIKVYPYLMNTWRKEVGYLYPELKSSTPSQEKRNKLRKKRKSKHK